MRILAFLVFGFGIALAGGGVFYVSEFAKEQRVGSANLELQTVRVLVAKHKLLPDAVLGTNNLQWTEWPQWSLPPGTFTSVETLLGERGDQQRLVRRTIEKGEPILTGKVWGLGESGRIPGGLGDEMRAVSIPVDAASSVSGFVRPGDRVDILLTRKLGDEIVSSVPLQNIEVLAVDQDKGIEGRSARVGRTVTVKVTPYQAQQLAVARQLGKLSLTLRARGSTATTDSGPVTGDDLNDLEKALAEEKKKVKVNRPDGSETVTFD